MHSWIAVEAWDVKAMLNNVQKGIVWGALVLVAGAILLMPLWSPPRVKVTTSAPVAPSSPPPRPRDPLAHFDISNGESFARHVIQQQETNLAKIRSIKFTYTVSTKPFEPGEDIETFTEREVVRSGNSAWCKKQWQNYNRKTGERQKAVDTTVWNGGYLAHWAEDVASDSLKIWEFASLESMPEDARVKKAMAWVDPEKRHGIGIDAGLLSFAEYLARVKDRRFEVAREERDGRTVYLLRIFAPAALPKPSRIVTIEPAKGYMTTRVTYWESKENDAAGLRVTPKEIAPGIWFPVAWERLGRKRDTNPQSITYLERGTYSGIEVNQPVSESLFTWQSLNVPPNTRVVWMDRRGKVAEMSLAEADAKTKTLESHAEESAISTLEEPPT